VEDGLEDLKVVLTVWGGNLLKSGPNLIPILVMINLVDVKGS